MLITVSGDATVRCSYTNEEFVYKYKNSEDMVFSDDENSEDYFYKGNDIILDDYLISIVDNAIPLKPIKKGASKPKSGEGYRFLTEDELEAERNSRKDPRWAALDDIEL